MIKFSIKDTVVGSLGQRITTQLLGLRGLHKQLSDVANYLRQVVDGTLPVNHPIVYHLQVRNNLNLVNVLLKQI